MTPLRPLAWMAVVCAACAAPRVPELVVSNARAPSPPGNVMAVYFTIQNPGATADTLLTGSAPGFSPFEVHETNSRDGMMTMRPVPFVVIPPRSEVSLLPGGLHGMLSGFDSKPLPGDTVRLTLTFTTAGARLVPVAIVTYSDLDP